VITAVSGEIHLGALGLVKADRTKMFELTASGIVHPPPGPLVVLAFEHLAKHEIRLAPDLTAARIVMPGHGRYYLRQRNWLALELSGDGAIEAVWRTEKGVGGRLVCAAGVNEALCSAAEDCGEVRSAP
jgi:hypothetical protein